MRLKFRKENVGEAGFPLTNQPHIQNVYGLISLVGLKIVQWSDTVTDVGQKYFKMYKSGSYSRPWPLSYKVSKTSSINKVKEEHLKGFGSLLAECRLWIGIILWLLTDINSRKECSMTVTQSFSHIVCFGKKKNVPNVILRNAVIPRSYHTRKMPPLNNES